MSRLASEGEKWVQENSAGNAQLSLLQLAHR
jgi:hypothetical protein